MPAGKMGDGLGHLDEFIFFSQAKTNLATTDILVPLLAGACTCQKLQVNSISLNY